ncbi:MAG TPA: CarD family transcriptional regulator, partial [Coriobacteriia bacterium]
MSLLADLSTLLERAPGFAQARGALQDGSDFTLAVPPSIRPLLVAATFRADPRATLVVVPGADAAERFARQLTAYLPLDLILPLPAPANLPWSRQPGDVAVTGRRARALFALQENRPAIVVASAAGLLRMLPPRGASEVFAPVVLTAGAALDLADVTDRLARLGYERVEVAEDPGQFAVRGGTLDLFPSDGHYPVRAELCGDEVESVRRYVPSTGQSVGDVERVEAYPCREIRLSNRTSKDVAHPYRSGFRDLQRRSLGEPQVAHELEMLEQGLYFDGVEAYLPYVYRELASVTDYLSKGALVAVAEPRAVFDDTLRTYAEAEAAGEATGQDVASYLVAPAKLDLGGRQRLTMLSILHTGAAVDAELVARRPDVAGGETKTIQGLAGLVETGHTVLLLARDRRQREQLASSLTAAGLPIALYSGVSHIRPGSERDVPGGLVDTAVNLGVADIPAGFVVPDAHLAVVSVDDAFPRSVRRAASSVDPTSLTFDFKPGDYVVHATHGIALFREITRREVLGAERDYLLLEYAKGDRLYVPVEQLERVTKYVGPDQS